MARGKAIIVPLLIAVLAVMTIGLGGCTKTEENVSEEAEVETASETAEDTTVLQPEPSKVWEMGGPEEIPLDAKAYHETWDDMVNDGWVDRTLLGYPSNGDEAYPVYMYHMNVNTDYVDPHYNAVSGELYERPKILITSGFHGAEKASPVFLRNVIHDMMSDPELAAIAVRYEWDIIPLVNPWGYSHSMLKGGKATNGFEKNSFRGYEIVENGEYNQGIRLNADALDCNRDWHDGEGGCPSEEAKLVRDVLNSGEYELVFDMHETQNTSACGFISVGKKSSDMSSEEYEERCNKVYTATAEAGIMTDYVVSDLFDVDEKDQTTYPWDGTPNATFRNYASGYTDEGSRTINVKHVPKYSICLEVSIYCPQFSRGEADVEFNRASNTYGNTFVHNFVKRFDELL